MKTISQHQRKFIFTICILLTCLLPNQLSLGYETISKTYAVKPFSQLRASSGFDVEFIHSDENKVIIEIGEDAAKKLMVENKGKELIIQLQDCINVSTKTMKATVYGNSLSSITMSGATTFSSDHTFGEKDMKINTSGASKMTILLKTENLDIDLSGASKLTVKGTAIKQMIEMSGASDYNGKGCKSMNIDISCSGASKAKLDCSGTLDAEASGASHVTYLNEPEKLYKKQSGASEIEKD